MKRPRETSPSSSHRPHTRPRLTGSNLEPVNTNAPRRFPHSAPVPIRGYSTFHASSFESRSLQDLQDDELSAPGRIENENPHYDSIPNPLTGQDFPSDHQVDISTPELTHSPTPPADNEPFPAYIVVDRHSLRPLLGWTTYKRLNRSTGLFEDHLVGVSETNVQVMGLIPQAFNGMDEMKTALWSIFRPCGKILSIIVFKEFEYHSLYTAQIDFENRGSALRGLRVNNGYFHNFTWHPLKISRRAYNHSLWGIVKSSELSELQTRLLNSNKRNIQFPLELETIYGDQFFTNFDLPMAPLHLENYRSFEDLGEEYRPSLIALDKNEQRQEHEIASFPLSSKRTEIHRRLSVERNRMKEHVHPELVGLVGYNWQTGKLDPLEVQQEEDEEDGGCEEDAGMEMDENMEHGTGEGEGEDGWMELVMDPWDERM
ncbi:hypothetical protein I204_06878 [Kwoniella mangroviensis CBS 8886]|uniref:uncharacterized protein n=1 Tax=Kwoniella mangroviensis CBS 8507 TaxID=1296122 RepID=UPI00080D0E06|nr:uncharacterized protein I203_01151 [Kwoniella mangroviensis CBS 8507]OCF69296.1 hypothetical protein I203_01151 [Kwoniella mangroviensis CBS 8507]OCF72497.1 hypothetical protein I204_06878 [Kwoniella mangroviensis CBS 8886]